MSVADERIAATTSQVGVSEILPGDLVLVSDEAWVRVTEPLMTMHRGMGLFDDFQVLLGARVESDDPAGTRIQTWKPTDRVTVRRREKPCR